MLTSRVVFTVASLGLAVLSTAAAQSVTVRGVRGLSFGTVLPGVPSHTLRTDPIASGQFELRGPPPKTVQLTFTLPAVLNGPAGATLPLSFATNDAGYSVSNAIGSQVAFNPNVPYTRTLGDNRTGVFLGGTVSPTVGQPAGAYTGSVVLSVVVF